MARDSTQRIPRKPRHPAATGAGIRVEVERPAEAVPRTVEAELADFSRDGFRLLTAVPLEPGESITVRLHDANSGFNLTLPSTVRWQRIADDRSWSHGCMFARQVDWETLGELFLNGILDTGDASFSPESEL